MVVKTCMIRALRAQVYTGFPNMKVSTLRALSPADGRYADLVRATSQRLMQQGIQGVPAFIVDNTWLVSGAQESTVFESLFEQLAPGEATVADAT